MTLLVILLLIAGAALLVVGLVTERVRWVAAGLICWILTDLIPALVDGR